MDFDSDEYRRTYMARPRTVGDLIAFLRTCPEDAAVCVSMGADVYSDAPESSVSVEVRVGGFKPSPTDASEGWFAQTGKVPSDPGWRSAVLLDWMPS